MLISSNTISARSRISLGAVKGFLNDSCLFDLRNTIRSHLSERSGLDCLRPTRSCVMTTSPLDALLATLDRHIDSQAAAVASSEAGPSSLGLQRNELGNLIAPSTSLSSSTEPQLSPLERSIYYEVENRRDNLSRKAKELDFWEAYETQLAGKVTKMPTSSSALQRQIADKKQELKQLEAENKLKVETARALESSAVIVKVLSTTSPAAKRDEQKADQKTYASTRKLLDERDDQALEFLRVFNQIRSIKKQRIEVKARIRGRLTWRAHLR